MDIMADKKQLSDEDLAAMLVAKDAYVKTLGGKKPKETKEIFFSGFQLGVAYARGDWKPPAEELVDDEAEEDDRADP